MARIPRAAIRQLVKGSIGAKITEAGAEELARMLEREAEEISRSAVENAAREGRYKVTKKDVMKCIMSRG